MKLKFCSIDQCRINNKEAGGFAGELYSMADFIREMEYEASHIFEFTGLGQHLPTFIKMATWEKMNPKYIVWLKCPAEECLDRVNTRVKEDIPFPYSGLTHKELINYFEKQNKDDILAKLGYRKTSFDYLIELDTNKMTPEECCKEIIKRTGYVRD